MKLHVHVISLITMLSAVAYASDAPSGKVTITYDSAHTGPLYGIESNVDSSKVTSIESTITEGADLSNSVSGGLELNNKTYENDFYNGYSGPSLVDGVVVNMDGGKALSIKGGNTINTNVYMDNVREYMGESLNVGSIQINVSGGELGVAGGSEEAIMGGGGRYCGAETIEVNISGGTVNNKVYGGTNGGTVETTAVNVSGGTINSDVYGGGRKPYGKTTGSTTVTLSGGTITGNVYAGGDEDTVEGTATVVLTGDGSKVVGTISGSGTKSAVVAGTRSLVFDASYTGEEAYSVGDFMEVDIETAAILKSLDTAAEGTLVTIADDATLTLGNVTVTEGGALEFRGGNVTIASDSVLDLGGTSITLNGTTLSSEGGFTVVVDSLDTADYAVFNVINANEMAALEGVEVTLQAGDGTTKTVSASSVTAVVPEPATATLSLLALAALAARRRRK